MFGITKGLIWLYLCPKLTNLSGYHFLHKVCKANLLLSILKTGAFVSFFVFVDNCLYQKTLSMYDKKSQANELKRLICLYVCHTFREQLVKKIRSKTIINLSDNFLSNYTPNIKQQTKFIMHYPLNSSQKQLVSWNKHLSLFTITF